MRAPARTDRRTGSIVRLVVLAWVAVMVVACGGSAAQAPAVGAPARAAASAGGNASGAGATGGGSQTGGNGNPAALVDDTKIVRTGSLQLTVADTDKALLAGRDAIRGLGGYIGSSQQQRSNDKIFATVTYRIPVASWEDALDAIRHLGTAVAEQTEAVEVTGQLVDLDARIRNLKASEAALVGYAANAPKIADLLEIESRLTDTRGEIERMTAEQAGLSDKAAMATLTVTFGTDVVAVAEAAAKWDPAAEVDRASARLIGVGQAVASFLILFTIVWLPILVVLAVFVYAGLRIARRLGWQRPADFPPIDPTPPTAPAAPAPPVPGA
jgi:Domain of unknown function (DUF4349)